MANRRMISKSISVSEQVNALDDFAALLFSWMIPHADDWGVIHGTAQKIKALIVPMRKKSFQQIEKAINDIENAGLIWRYVYKDEHYIQFRQWERHQEGLHKRTTAKNPTFEMINTLSRNFPETPA